MRLVIPILAALLLAGCGSAPDDEGEQDVPGFGSNGRRQLIGLDVSTSGEKLGERYLFYDVKRDHRGSGRAFAGYGCTGDCGDVRAGYAQAEAGAIRDMGQCTGKTWGELEGCVAFTQNLPATITKLSPLAGE